MASVPTAPDSGGSLPSLGRDQILANGSSAMDTSGPPSLPHEDSKRQPATTVEGYANKVTCTEQIVPNFGWDLMTFDDSDTGPDCLGRGAFGSCFKVKHQILGTATIKINKPRTPTLGTRNKTDDDVFKERRETALGLMLNHHPNIVAFFGYAYKTDPEHPEAFLMEYMAGGNLFSYICDNSNKPVDVKRANTWSRQIAQGLCFIHNRNIMHRDLNANNILLSRDFLTAKIADFGLGKKVEEGADAWKHTINVGTTVYRAPEIFVDEKYTYEVDIWSYAMTLYFIYYHQHPFDDADFKRWGNFTTVQKLMGKYGSELELRPKIGRFPDVQDRVMVGCWNTVPKNRWRIRKVLDELDKFPVDIFPVENV